MWPGVNLLLRYLSKRESTASPEVEDALWQRIESTIKIRKRRSVMRYLKWSFSTAAAVLLFVWLGHNYYASKEPDLKTLAALLPATVSESDEVILTRGNDKQIAIKNGSVVSYSSQGTVSVDKTVMEKEGEEDVYNQIIVPKGKHSQLLLADGTRVDINAGSRVVYPSCFKKGRREIYIEGEAFLDVKRDETAPFLVKTSHFEIEVLGTAFNVNAYKDDESSSVVLLRGAVNVKSESGGTLNLVPNELASIKGGMIQGKRKVNAEEYVSWINGILILKNEPLNEVFRRLERFFDRKIILSGTIPATPLCGKIDLNEGIEEIIRFISVTAPVVVEERNDIFYISPE